MKIKLHVQLEPYLGIKFDFIEVEVESLAQVKEVYEQLPVKLGKAQYTKPAATNTSQAGEIRPTEKQAKLIADLGGKRTTFKDSVDLNKYIKYMYENRKPQQQAIQTQPAQQPQAQAVQQQEPVDVPWVQLDL